MKKSEIILVALAVIVLSFMTIKKFWWKDKSDPKADKDYIAMRTMALNATPAQINQAIPDSELKVYGVIMDVDLGKSCATLVSFITGDASIYTSSGKKFLGGVKYKNISDASVVFVNTAQANLTKAKPDTTTALPVKGYVKFYFLTNKGRYVANEQEKNIDDKTSPYLDLFTKGNNVISEIQQTIKKAE